MNSKSSFKSASGPKHWLLVKSRQWHKWGGLIAGVFLLVVGMSGIVLNYKAALFKTLGLENGPPERPTANLPKSTIPTPAFTTATGFAAMPVELERALEVARLQWGDVALERIELKHERGEMIYKIKRKGGDELWVNAVTGSHFVKGEYKRMSKPGRGDSAPALRTDWGKILLDLHTGKIGGEAGKAVMSLVALGLLFLTASGIYMWAKPLLIRRQNHRKPPAESRAARLAHVTTAIPASIAQPAGISQEAVQLHSAVSSAGNTTRFACATSFGNQFQPTANLSTSSAPNRPT